MCYDDDDDGDDDDDDDIDIMMHHCTNNDYDNDNGMLCTVQYVCDCEAHNSCLHCLISVPKDSSEAYRITHDLIEI